MNLTQPTPADIERAIRNIPDFPKPGIVFKDITPLLAEPKAFRQAIDQLCEHYRGQQIDAVAAAEARGFLFAAPMALALNIGKCTLLGNSRENNEDAIDVKGIAERVGSIEPGKDADVVVWSGDPFEPLSQPKAVFIKGEEQPLTSRQLELRDRYRNLNTPYPPEYH